MTFEILIQIFFLGIGLSMDAFSVALTDGLTYKDIDKKKSFFIAGTFGFLQALMPLIGFFLVEIVELIVGETAGAKAGELISTQACALPPAMRCTTYHPKTAILYTVYPKSLLSR